MIAGSGEMGHAKLVYIRIFITAIPQPEETEVLKGLLQREGGEI